MKDYKIDTGRKRLGNFIVACFFVAFGIAFLLGTIFYKPTEKMIINDSDSSYLTDYKEGIHYTELKKPLDLEDNNVLVYFWYGCPHCYSASNALTPWLKERGDSVVIDLRHSQLGSSWSNDAKFFYTQSLMNLNPSVHDDYFRLRHNGNSASKSLLITLNKNSVDINEFNLVMDSDSIKNIMKDNFFIEKTLKTQGVPSVVVSGKYLIKLEGLNGSWDNLPSIIDHLIDKK